MTDVDLIRDLARKIRFRIISSSHISGTPHLGSCLSCLDLLIFLYWRVLKVDPQNFLESDRDRFILSKGHAAPALFHVLAERGFFSFADLAKFGVDGSVFGEHPPAPGHLTGIEAATGSLGHGLPMGIGMALSSGLSNKSFNVYVMVGDGECNEGSVWEAAMFAAAKKIKNLFVIVDYNKWQATGRSNEVMSLDSLAEKWRAFGWRVSEIDGHNFNEIDATFQTIKSDPKPKCIIANTVKGKGISFMEDDNNWHYRIPNFDELNLAAQELKITKEEYEFTFANLGGLK